MSNQQEVFKKYKKTQIDTANQGKLILMLYDGAIKFINQALDLLKDKKSNNLEQIHKCIVKSQDIIYELTSSLNMDVGEISQRLFSIYMYINRKLAEANIQKEEKPLLEVKQYLLELRTAWDEAIKKAPKETGEVQEGGVNIAT